jgi:cyclophilin family peptidyl-prolyl cis-trans isomerase
MRLAITLFTFSLSALVLVGAGCGTGNVVVPASDANADFAVTSRTVAARNVAEPPVAKSDSTMNPSDRPTYSFPGVLSAEETHGKRVRIETAKGAIVFDMLEAEAPKTVSNFVYLAKQGFYDGLKFHRVVPGFVIQGGDPLGNGTGGPGYKFEDEPVYLDYEAGIVAMANSGPDTNGSQFFIVLDDQPTLPKQYTIFGRVISGMETVESIAVGDVMTKVTVEGRP